MRRVEEDCRMIRDDFLWHEETPVTESLAMEVLVVLWNRKMEIAVASRVVVLCRSAYVLVTGTNVVFPAAAQLKRLMILQHVSWEGYVFFAASSTYTPNARVLAQSDAYRRWLLWLDWRHKPIVHGTVLDEAVCSVVRPGPLECRRVYCLYGFLFAFNTAPSKHLFGIPRCAALHSTIRFWPSADEHTFLSELSLFT